MSKKRGLATSYDEKKTVFKNLRSPKEVCLVKKGAYYRIWGKASFR
jgi:hypothetical protein